jgi:hypothetical protein
MRARGLLTTHRPPGIHTTQLTDSARQIYAATYGDPPDPPAPTRADRDPCITGVTLGERSGQSIHGLLASQQAA